jgi:hypothetical protein
VEVCSVLNLHLIVFSIFPHTPIVPEFHSHVSTERFGSGKPIGFTFAASDSRGSVGNPGCEDNPYTDAGSQGIRAKPNKVTGIQFYDHSGRKRRKRSYCVCKQIHLTK